MRKSVKVIDVSHSDDRTQIQVNDSEYFIVGDLVIHNRIIYQVLRVLNGCLIILKNIDVKKGDTVHHWRNNFYTEE